MHSFTLLADICGLRTATSSNRAFVYLSNLFYGVSVSFRAAVVNERGDVQGFVRVTVQPVLREEVEQCGVGMARIYFNDDEYFQKVR